MRKFIHAIVYVLFIAGIPFQAYAATLLILSQSPQAASGQHYASHHPMQHKHHHAASGIPSPDPHHDDNERSLCNAYCVGAAIVPDFFSGFPGAAIASEAIAFNSAHFYRIAPRRLERPPLHILL